MGIPSQAGKVVYKQDSWKVFLENLHHDITGISSIALLLVVGPDRQVKTVSAIEIFRCRVCFSFKQKVDCLSFAIVGCKMQWSSLKFIMKQYEQVYTEVQKAVATDL